MGCTGSSPGFQINILYRSNVGELERIKKQRQQKIAELEKVRNNKTARFGRNIPALQEEIEKLVKAGRFKRRPYGPLGAHITMKDMNYVLGAERALGNTFILLSMKSFPSPPFVWS